MAKLIFADAASLLALIFTMAMRSSRQAPISQFCYTVKILLLHSQVHHVAF